MQSSIPLYELRGQVGGDTLSPTFAFNPIESKQPQQKDTLIIIAIVAIVFMLFKK